MKKIKRKFSTGFYVLSILITLLIFLIGLGIGDYITQSKVRWIQNSEREILNSFNEFNQKMVNIENRQEYCNLSWEDLWKEKVEIGTILAKLEENLGKDDEEVKEQKKIYNDVQIELKGILESIEENCNYNWTIILFFYTNDDSLEEQKLSELQGYVLDSLYHENSNIKILTFDLSANTPILEKLRQENKISELPSLVINGKKYSGFKGKEDVKKIIQK
jgi:hypothetical protein